MAPRAIAAYTAPLPAKIRMRYTCLLPNKNATSSTQGTGRVCRFSRRSGSWCNLLGEPDLHQARRDRPEQRGQTLALTDREIVVARALRRRRPVAQTRVDVGRRHARRRPRRRIRTRMWRGRCQRALAPLVGLARTRRIRRAEETHGVDLHVVGGSSLAVPTELQLIAQRQHVRVVL